MHGVLLPRAGAARGVRHAEPEAPRVVVHQLLDQRARPPGPLHAVPSQLSTNVCSWCSVPVHIRRVLLPLPGLSLPETTRVSFPNLPT